MSRVNFCRENSNIIKGIYLTWFDKASSQLIFHFIYFSCSIDFVFYYSTTTWRLFSKTWIGLFFHSNFKNILFHKLIKSKKFKVVSITSLQYFSIDNNDDGIALICDVRESKLHKISFSFFFFSLIKAALSVAIQIVPWWCSWRKKKSKA